MGTWDGDNWIHILCEEGDEPHPKHEVFIDPAWTE